ncbi:MAG: hypothetical protein ABF915_12580 [Schleiferilactobacillus harbinensis]
MATTHSFLVRCGKLLNLVRLRRNFSINDIRGNTTQPTVTNFEHGRSDIGFTNFHMLLSNSYMGADEFFALVDADDNDFLSSFIVEFRRASNHDDLAALAALKEKIIADYPGSRKHGPKDMLLLCIKGMTGYIKDPSFMFSAEDVTRLENYLNLGNGWFFFEYTVFSATAQFLPVQVASQLADAMLTSFRKTQTGDYDNAVAAVLFNLCLAWLYHKKAAEAVALLQRAQTEISKSRDPYIASRVYVLQQAFIYLGDQSPVALQHIKLIEDGLAFYDPELRANDVHWLAKIGITV